MTIGEIIGDGAEAEVPAVEEETETPREEMTVEEIGENTNKIIMTIRDKVKKILQGDEENSGIITMTIGTEVETVKVMVEVRNGIKDVVKEIEVEVADGINTNNTLPQDMSQPQIIKIQTTTDRRLWDIKPHTHRDHLSTQFILHNHNSNIQCRARRHDHNKLLMFVNYVKMLGILTTNASSPVTS